MSYRLSILDKSPIGEGETAATALSRTLRLAQLAEEWGYHRFWIAEHHNTPQLASPSPELVIALDPANPAYPRWFRRRDAATLQPVQSGGKLQSSGITGSGRVDLGVGKAHGGLPLSTQALQHGLHQEEKAVLPISFLSLTAGWR